MQEVGFWFSKRFLVGVLAFFGEMNNFSLKANINMAILDMTSGRKVIVENTTTIQVSSLITAFHFPITECDTNMCNFLQNPEFQWDSSTKGFVLGTHAYGSMFSIVGGYLALRYGGSTVIAISSLVASVLTISNPFAIRFHFYLFILFRVLEGASEVLHPYFFQSTSQKQI